MVGDDTQAGVVVRKGGGASEWAAVVETDTQADSCSGNRLGWDEAMDSFDLYFLVREEQQEWLDRETEALSSEIDELNFDLETRYKALLEKAFEEKLLDNVIYVQHARINEKKMLLRMEHDKNKIKLSGITVDDLWEQHSHYSEWCDDYDERLKKHLAKEEERFERKDIKKRTQKARMENAAQDAKRISELEQKIEILLKRVGE